MKEIYKKVIGYDNYQVSNYGNVKRENKILKNNPFKNGYIYISLSKNGIVTKRTIHCLVAEMFLNHKRTGTNEIVIDHIDGNKQNNNLLNLQLISNRENCTKEKRGNSSVYIGVRKNKGKFESQIRLEGKRFYLGRFETEIEAHNAYQNSLNEFNKRAKST